MIGISKKILFIFMMLAIFLNSTVYAASPKFSRSEEEWKKLEDNVLEFSEIDDLIHEYNAAVINNSAELSKFKKTYGTTNDEIKKSYEELANELMSAIDYGSASSMDPTYGMRAAAMIANESRAKSLLSQADSSLEDAEIYRLNYEMAEKTLARTAKLNMISYNSNLISAEQSRINIEVLQSALRIEETKKNLGMATQVDVLTASENLLNAQQALTKNESASAQAAKKLQVSCGWKYDSQPEFMELPEPDFDRIATISVASDTEKALENNYTLKVNERKLKNAVSSSDIDTLKVTIESNRQNITVSVNNAYNQIKSAADAYAFSVSTQTLESNNFAIAASKYSLGNISRFEFESQQAKTQIANLSVKLSKYALLQALTEYDYIVNGLAGA